MKKMKTFERVGNFLKIAVRGNKDSLYLWPFGSFTVSIIAESIVFSQIEPGDSPITIHLPDMTEDANKMIKELEEALK